MLLSGPPDETQLEAVRNFTGDDTDLGRAIKALALMASRTTAQDVRREYNALFIGLSRGELLPYASYYLTGFLNEKPLATLRGHMTMLGIVRAEGESDPEDHIAALCEMMAGFIRGDYGARLSLADQDAFFNTHVGTWATHFFTDLEGASQSVFYAPVGAIGRAFMAIEIDAFRMTRLAQAG
ncbi:MAG: molecular chaperone TorD family protein [Pseudomonadota bacterium]